jgi:hypothetical protein
MFYGAGKPFARQIGTFGSSILNAKPMNFWPNVTVRVELSNNWSKFALEMLFPLTILYMATALCWWFERCR